MRHRTRAATDRRGRSPETPRSARRRGQAARWPRYGARARPRRRHRSWRASSVLGENEGGRGGKGHVHAVSRGEQLVLPRITDVDFEHEPGRRLDVVAERAAEIRGEPNATLDAIFAAAVQRDVLGPHGQHTGGAGRTITPARADATE